MTTCANRHPMWMMSRSPTPERVQLEPVPFEFTGRINKVVFDINPRLNEADLQAIQHEPHAALADGISA